MAIIGEEKRLVVDVVEHLAGTLTTLDPYEDPLGFTPDGSCDVLYYPNLVVAKSLYRTVRHDGHDALLTGDGPDALFAGGPKRSALLGPDTAVRRLKQALRAVRAGWLEPAAALATVDIRFASAPPRFHGWRRNLRHTLEHPYGLFDALMNAQMAIDIESLGLTLRHPWLTDELGQYAGGLSVKWAQNGKPLIRAAVRLAGLPHALLDTPKFSYLCTAAEASRRHGPEWAPLLRHLEGIVPIHRIPEILPRLIDMSDTDGYAFRCLQVALWANATGATR